MNRDRTGATFRCLLVILCMVVLTTSDTLAYISSSWQESTSAQSQVSKISPDQLDSLVAPIALYPDPLLAQALAASTYPLEIIQLQQWLRPESCRQRSPRPYPIHRGCRPRGFHGSKKHWARLPVVEQPSFPSRRSERSIARRTRQQQSAFSLDHPCFWHFLRKA